MKSLNRMEQTTSPVTLDRVVENTIYHIVKVSLFLSDKVKKMIKHLSNCQTNVQGRSKKVCKTKLSFTIVQNKYKHKYLDMTFENKNTGNLT